MCNLSATTYSIDRIIIESENVSFFRACLVFVMDYWWLNWIWTFADRSKTNGVFRYDMPADVAKIVYSTLIFQMCQRLDMYRDELNALFDKNKEWKPDLVQDQ